MSETGHLQRLFRKIAKMVHPDVGAAKNDRFGQLREDLMTRANIAYEKGDCAALESILQAWQERDSRPTKGAVRPTERDARPTDGIRWVRVVSSNVDSIGYDDSSATLYVRFKTNGSRYFYSGVAREVYIQFLNAPSKGKFLNWHIIGRYKYGKM